MFVGTASHVGKSVITAAFCRIFKQDGYHPAPFKGQNMSLNSFVTPDGGEIGRAQAVQAEAAGTDCDTDMNPVLLKPTTDQRSQVILHGRPIGTQSAYDYFTGNNRQELFGEVTQAFDRLTQRFNPIVMEGAGSISELNLKSRDITNMRLAQHAGAATYLISDIDRGGVFGSLYGTMALLSPPERACIKGIIINKFRGDSRLFEDGRKMIEELCGVPVIGVLPYFRDIRIEEEDSVSLKQKHPDRESGKVNIAVVLLNRLSNFTDFDHLEHDPRVHLFYTHRPADIEQSDIIVLPGSKNTIDDIVAIKKNGIAQAILHAHGKGKTVIGICGGYQMMGERVEDPDGVESLAGEEAGLGLLPVTTRLLPEKTTIRRQFTHRDSNEPCSGYEIHMGETVSLGGGHQPVNHLPDGRTDGYFSSPSCWGTYMHGIFDNPSTINLLLSSFGARPAAGHSYREYKEEQYDKLAALLREHIDMEKVYTHLNPDL